MGQGEYGGMHKTSGASSVHNLTDNVPKLKSCFTATPEGYFGVKGSHTSIRRIASLCPLNTANRFFRIASEGGCSIDTGDPNRLLRKMKDGSTVSLRIRSSSDGTPAVEVRIGKMNFGQIKEQKIHFIKED